MNLPIVAAGTVRTLGALGPSSSLQGQLEATSRPVPGESVTVPHSLSDCDWASEWQLQVDSELGGNSHCDHPGQWQAASDNDFQGRGI